MREIGVVVLHFLSKDNFKNSFCNYCRLFMFYIIRVEFSGSPPLQKFKNIANVNKTATNFSAITSN